jgi:hypothetical protein
MLCLTFAYFGNLEQWKFCTKERKKFTEIMFMYSLFACKFGWTFVQTEALTGMSMSHILVVKK